MKFFSPILIFIFICAFNFCSAQVFNATITGGYESGAFICGNGNVYAWGEGSGGEVGDNGGVDRKSPVQVKGINNVGFLSNINYLNGSTGSHVLALVKDTVIWWGSWTGASGTITSKYPIYLSANAGNAKFYDVKEVNSGVFVSYAIKTDGTLWSWGLDDYGKLGDNNVANSNKTYPVQVVSNTSPFSPLTNIISVSAGDDHAIALRSDGTVWAWGLNASGQLGNNTTTDSYRAVQVKNSTNTGFLTGIKQIAAIDAGALALDSNDRLWAWGDNWAGQLGIDYNIYANRKLPTRVSGIGGTGYLSNILEIKGGNSHSLVLLKDGTVVTFGSNEYGQLGQNVSPGTTFQKWEPTRVVATSGGGNLTKIARIYRGDNFNYAADSLGNLYTWGDNAKGELGIGNTTQKIRPVSLSLPASCSLIVLPVDLTDISVHRMNEKEVELRWTSSMEKDFSHYEVERSDNGLYFEPIGKVYGKNHSKEINHYHFKDQFTKDDQIKYYRLTMVDMDGQKSISPVVYMEPQAGYDMEIYPNPAEVSECLFVTCQSEEEGYVTCSIKSLVGEDLYNEEAKVNVGFNTIKISNPISKQGVYVVTVVNSSVKKDFIWIVR